MRKEFDIDSPVLSKAGRFQDPEFQAVLSIVYDVPFNPLDFIVMQETEKVGIILVSLFINGQKSYVRVDDHLPCTQDGSLASLLCSDGTLWASYIQKAWAKLNGSYHNISKGGDVAMIYTHLFGLPA